MQYKLKRRLKNLLLLTKLLIALLAISSFQHVSPPDQFDWEAKYEYVAQLANEGKCEEAIPLLKDYIASKPTHDRDTTLRKIYFKLENCLCEEGYEVAILFLEKEINRKDLSPYLRAWLLSWLAADCDIIGAKNKSIQFYETGLPLAEKIYQQEKVEEKERRKDTELLRNYYLSLGRVCWSQGNHAKALPFLLKGLQYAEQTKMIDRIAEALGYVGDCYKSMYDPRALDYFRRSIALQHDYVQGYIQFSKAYMQLQMPDSALWILQQAQLLPKDPEDETDFYYQYANVYLQTGKISEALIHIRKALKANGYPEDDAEYNRLIHLVGKIHLAADDLNTALFWFDKVLRKRGASGLEASNIHESDFFTLGSLEGKGTALLRQYQKNGNRDNLLEAVAAFESGLQYAEKMRLSYSNESSKLELYEFMQLVVEGGVQCFLALAQASGTQEYVEKAFLFAERAKAAVMSEALYDRDILHISGIPDSVLQQENELQEAVGKVEKDLDESPGTDSLQTKLNALKLSLERLKSDIQTRFPRYYALKYAFSRQISLSQIRAQLDEQALLIQYLAGEKTFYAFAVSKNSIRSFLIPKDAHFDSTLNRFYQSVSNWKLAKDSSAVAERYFLETAPELYRLLLKPALAGTTANRLVLVPDGLLGLIPFDALLTEQHSGSWLDTDMPYLLKKYAVSTRWSASTSPAAGIDAGAITSHFLGFGTNYQNGKMDTVQLVAMRDLGLLPHAPEEIKAVGRLFSGKTWLNEAATKVNFTNHASESGIIHLALHGVLDQQNPMRSHLVFQPDVQGVENRLFASELYNFRLNARMVVLSACNSGNGKVANGEGVMSLARAFTYAGCPTLVSSLWNVNDLSTAQIMQNFYQSLQSDLPVDRALQQAKLDFLHSTHSEFAKPIYWASFIVIGDSSALPKALTEPPFPWWWILGGVASVALLLAVFVYFRRTQKKAT